MNAQLQRERLARKDLLAALWDELKAEEAKAKKNRKSPDWRKVLKTQSMREDAAQSNS